MADAVIVQGLKEFRRDLKRLEPEVDKQLRGDIKKVAAVVSVEASAAARSFSKTGAFAASIRPYVSGTKAQIGSRLPQAGVVHFGGTIRPRGVPIVFKPRPVISLIVDRSTDRIVDGIGDAIEQAARNAGWH